MKRALLRLGDKTSAGGSVLEGVENRTHCGIPLTFIGAEVWCPACSSTGVIGWKGPHLTATMMGKQQALDGDICLCKCNPPPVLFASHDSAWHVFTAHEIAAMGDPNGGEPPKPESAGDYDEQVVVSARDVSLLDYPYLIELPKGGIVCGYVDADGSLPRIYTASAETCSIHWGDEALGHRGWK